MCQLLWKVKKYCVFYYSKISSKAFSRRNYGWESASTTLIFSADVHTWKSLDLTAIWNSPLSCKTYPTKKNCNGDHFCFIYQSQLHHTWWWCHQINKIRINLGIYDPSHHPYHLIPTGQFEEQWYREIIMWNFPTTVLCTCYLWATWGDHGPSPNHIRLNSCLCSRLVRWAESHFLPWRF